MRRGRLGAAGFLALAAGALLLVAVADERRGGPSMVGQMAPEFTLPDLSGRSVALESFRGKEVVQIVGWATWCPGCQREIPRMVETYQRLHSRGFEILAITGPMGQSRRQVQDFVRERGLPYPVLFDEDNQVLDRYGVYFIPYTCLLNRDGRIVYEGSHLPNDYEKRVEKLLSAADPTS